MPLAQCYPGLPPIARGTSCPLKVDKTAEKLLYKSGNTVVLRDIKPKPDGSFGVMLYTQHSYPVTAATMAPSGCYIASGDDHGNLRVWACDNPEQPIKLETPLFAGAILDIAWSPDSQRILAVGDGGSIYGRVIMWDSGNSVGEISGHMKKINSCSFKSSRPFRLCTGGEDNKVNFFEGPPFKFKATLKSHERFVNTVRFAPDGATFFSSSSDSVVALYDGKDGTVLKERKVHTGSIYDACWSIDGKQILTCSGDGSCKVLDGTSLDDVATLNFKSGDRKKTVAEQQVGCAWSAAGVLSYALGGELRLYSSPTDASPSLTQFGHHKPVNALAYDASKKTLYSGSFCDATGTLRGVVLAWDLTTGIAKALEGEPHTNGVMGLAVCAGGVVVACASDDTISFSSPPSMGSRVPIGACPLAMSASANLVCVVTTTDKLVSFSVSKQDKSGEVKLPFSPTCVAVAPSDGLVAVGGEDSLVHVLAPDGTEKLTLTRHKDKLSCVAFSPASDKLASGCANKEIVVWDATNGTPLVTGLQGFHTARISCLAWSSEAVLASGGVDAQILVWDLETKKAKEKLPLAHTSGAIRSLVWTSDGEIASGGGDACIKRWNVGPVAVS